MNPNSLRARDPVQDTQHHRRHHHGDASSRRHRDNSSDNRTFGAESLANESAIWLNDSYYNDTTTQWLTNITSAVETILLNLNDGKLGSTSPTINTIQQVPPTLVSKVKSIDPRTRENELEKDSSTVSARLTAERGKSVLDLQAGLNPDIEVTIEVLHDRHLETTTSAALPTAASNFFLHSSDSDDSDGEDDYDYVYDFDDLYPPGRVNESPDLSIESSVEGDAEESELGLSFEMEAVGSGETELSGEIAFVFYFSSLLCFLQSYIFLLILTLCSPSTPILLSLLFNNFLDSLSFCLNFHEISLSPWQQSFFSNFIPNPCLFSLSFLPFSLSQVHSR